MFQSEKMHQDRNRSLAYYMRENKAFPLKTDIERTLDLYSQACSTTVTCQSLAAIAGALANHGESPVTGERVLPPEIVRDCLSLMLTNGMYTYRLALAFTLLCLTPAPQMYGQASLTVGAPYNGTCSGQWSFEVGLPATSGVSGALLVVIPNVAGLAVWSPCLDKHGSSVRAVEFTKRFVSATNYHVFHESISKKSRKKMEGESRVHPDLQLLAACSSGDLHLARTLISMVGPNVVSKYDQRTPLHVATTEGDKNMVQLLLDCGADPTCKDKFGNTPLSEARAALDDESAELDVVHLVQEAVEEWMACRPLSTPARMVSTAAPANIGENTG